MRRLRLVAEQQSPRKLAPFDPSHFDKYIGYYELAPNLLFNITRDGGRFYAQFANALERGIALDPVENASGSSTNPNSAVA